MSKPKYDYQLMQNRQFEYNELNRLILEGILHSLEIRQEDILAFPRHPIGTSAIRGMAVDIFPWHRQIQISFCTSNDKFQPSAVPEWKYFGFIDSIDEKYELLAKAADYIFAFWEGDFDDEGTDLEEYFIEPALKANVIFYAGATAILAPEVTERLGKLGIKVSSPDTFFIVSNDDAPNRNNNYCEIVKSVADLKLFFDELAIAKSIE